jgi:hypothetical protein
MHHLRGGASSHVNIDEMIVLAPDQPGALESTGVSEQGPPNSGSRRQLSRMPTGEF